METSGNMAGSLSPENEQIPPVNASMPNDSQSKPTSASQAAQRIRRRNRMITSCLECRRRKLKCDKLHPCTNCAKFSRDCVFLAPALDSASQLKLTEIKEKMGSLEKVLENDVAKKKELSAQKKASQRQSNRRNSNIERLPGQASSDEEDAAEPEDERDLEPTPLAIPDAAYEGDGDDDDIVDLGYRLGRMRMNERVGGFFRPKMTEEISFALGGRFQSTGSEMSERSPPDYLQKLFAPYDTPSPASSTSFLEPGPTYIAPRSGFFFSSREQSGSLIDYLPSKPAANILVEQYHVAVHPIAKVVHWPSFMSSYENFWSNIGMGIEPVGSLQAVVFAVMFSAIVSMPDEQIHQAFGLQKQNMIESFQTGTEMALGKANFLRTTKIETLQALVIYTIPMCRAEMSRAHSALVGAAIKLGECMGLHRDPSNYGASPLDTHIRRTLWYQLCFLDIRTCEAQGPRPSIRREDFDTQFPLNIDDADLSLADQRPTASSRFTDNTIARIRFECNEMHRTIWIDRPRLERKETTLTAIMTKTESFRKAMEANYHAMLDASSNPLARFVKILLDVLINRMTTMILHRYHNSVSIRMPDRLRQVLLTHGTQQMEDSVTLDTDPAFATWNWYNGAYTQYHVAFLLLIEIFAYPMRREADRIWRCLDYVYEIKRPERSRDEKARDILTEMRDKAAAYKNVRRMRAPVDMMRKLVAKEDKTRKGSMRERAIDDLMDFARVEAENEKDKEIAFAQSQAQAPGSVSSQPQATASPSHDGQTLTTSSPAMSSAALDSSWNFDAQATLFTPPGWIKKSSWTAGNPTSRSGATPPVLETLDSPPFTSYMHPQTSIPLRETNFGSGGFGAGVNAMMPMMPVIPNQESMEIDWSEWDKLFPPEINTGNLNS